MKIGNRDIVFTHTFLIPFQETAELSFTLPDGDSIVAHINFDPTEGGGKSGIRWDAEAHAIKLTFFGSLTSLGASTQGFQQIGTVDDKPFGFTAVYHRHHSIDSLHIQFLCGGTTN